MRVPNGNIKISRVVTITADTTKALHLGVAAIMASQTQQKRLLFISAYAYNSLKEYINEVTPDDPASESSSKAFAMALMLGALMQAAASDDDDD
jgi:hypothetical protein